jgi:macrolide-specific efflux system membrane fusion protein
VSYTVQIGFDTQDSRVKPGMTVNADIQTAVHQNVVVVPASAIKTVAGQNFVQVIEPRVDTATVLASDVTLVQVPVTIGISDNTNTEILSGLPAGAQIVVRSTGGSSTASTAGATNRAGAGGFGGAGVRAGAAIRLP